MEFEKKMEREKMGKISTKTLSNSLAEKEEEKMVLEKDFFFF